ncbi:MAG: hypothetical protein ACI3VX_00775 [Faecousia sp.]|nr:hypothetical protein [Bacillota bacterium]MDY2720146.1 hypothetical protein [Candidatus Faecousia sp.]
MLFLSNALTEHPVTIALALVAVIVWTMGNYLKKKFLIYIGIGLTVLAVLTFTDVFSVLLGL